MLIFERKPFEEICSALEGRKKVLILGCGTCPTIRLAGGEREVAVLASQIKLAFKEKLEVIELTIQRQCDVEFFDEIKEKVAQYDRVLSMACGVGVQLATEVLDVVCFPVNNTCFIGSSIAQGEWVERCQACGNCVLFQTAGVCPITRCSKSLLNGPCGGSQDGKCEVSPEVPCAWQLIYDRLKARNQLKRLEEIRPPQDWSKKSIPGKIVREDLLLEEESK